MINILKWKKNQILALFGRYFWLFNNSHAKLLSHFWDQRIIGPSISNVFIKFWWPGEKLTRADTIVLHKVHTLKKEPSPWYFVVRISARLLQKKSWGFLTYCKKTKKKCTHMLNFAQTQHMNYIWGTVCHLPIFRKKSFVDSCVAWNWLKLRI